MKTKMLAAQAVTALALCGLFASSASAGEAAENTTCDPVAAAQTPDFGGSCWIVVADVEVMQACIDQNVDNPDEPWGKAEIEGVAACVGANGTGVSLSRGKLGAKVKKPARSQGRRSAKRHLQPSLSRAEIALAR